MVTQPENQGVNFLEAPTATLSTPPTMIHGGSPIQDCLAPHTITVLQPEEPRHLPQPPPMTATDPQSHVGTNSYNAYQSPRQTARPNNSVSHPLSLTLEASSLHFSPPRIQ
ncbi:hypothetical protein H671_2g7909 [Cricetulus griseus]|nr:hypothetical protein H671_2g7909 [Cricetulus griseus]